MQERGYNVSRSTIYNILRQNRIRSPQRKKKKRKKKTTTGIALPKAPSSKISADDKKNN